MSEVPPAQNWNAHDDDEQDHASDATTDRERDPTGPRPP
jgi:hypothetical protein